MTIKDEMTAIAVDLAAKYIASEGEKCDVCLREDAYAVGRVTGVWLPGTGLRHSAPACGDCVLLLHTSDWGGLERLVFAYQAQGWTLWESITCRRRARRVARNVARWNGALFANLTDPNGAPQEGAAA